MIRSSSRELFACLRDPRARADRPLGGDQFRRPVQIEQGLGALGAVGGGFELKGAGRTAGGATRDAAKVIEGEADFTSAATGRTHGLLLEPSAEGEVARRDPHRITA